MSQIDLSIVTEEVLRVAEIIVDIHRNGED
jgi:hypothetical protein